MRKIKMYTKSDAEKIKDAKIVRIEAELCKLKQKEMQNN
jgi:hypothetical protein